MTNNFPQSPFNPGVYPGGVGATTVTTPKKGKRRKEKTPGRRNVRGLGWLFLLFAGAFGLLAVIVTSSPGSTVLVARAAGDIPAMSQLSVEQFTLTAIDRDALEPGAFSAESEEELTATLTEAIDGKWPVQNIFTGQQLRAEMLSANTTLNTPLASDERLISITARVSNAVAGGVRPGDKVDVFVSDGDGLTGVLGQGVEIVGVSLLPDQFDAVAQEQFENPDKVLSDFLPKSPVGGTYIIRVKAVDVARYVTADTSGKITLALHGENASGFPAVPVDLYEAICGRTSGVVACTRTVP